MSGIPEFLDTDGDGVISEAERQAFVEARKAASNSDDGSDYGIPGGPSAWVTNGDGSEAGVPTIHRPGYPGFSYQMEYSPDLLIWFDDLRFSEILDNSTEEMLTFSDPEASSAARRFCKVIRRPIR